jgi:hypothetical protein
MVLGAASLTLAVTLLRLMLELGKAPAWLAKRDAGGAGALIGIAWLPFVFGPYFAHRLRTGAETTWALLKRLLKTLVVYGWSAHVPVVIITLLALGFGWDTHYNKFGPENEAMATWKKIAATLGAQLVFWSVIWTPVAGGLAGLLFHLIVPKRADEPVETKRTQPAS